MTIRELFKKSLVRWWNADPGSLGAALSFYAFFSLTPLLSFGLIIFGKLLPLSLLEQQIVYTSYTFAGEGVANSIREFLNNPHTLSENVLASIVALAILLFGSLGVFSQLQLSLNRLWHAPEQGGVMLYIKEKTLAFVLFLILGLLLVCSVVATIVVSVFWQFISTRFITFNLPIAIPFAQAITFLSTTLFILFLYKLMARKTLKNEALLLGSLGTATFFMIGEYLLRGYLSSYSFSSSYGTLGTLAVLLIWVYYSSQIFFYGAAWTYTLNEELRKSEKH